MCSFPAAYSRPYFHHVRQGVQYTSMKFQWHRQQTDGTKHLLEAYNIKVTSIQESHLTAQSRSPNINNYTLVRQDRCLCPGGGLLFLFIHNSVNFTRKPQSTSWKNDPHLEELTISITMDNTELLITNVYIPPASSCNWCYSQPLDHMLTGTDSLVLGDFNDHH